MVFKKKKKKKKKKIYFFKLEIKSKQTIVFLIGLEGVGHHLFMDLWEKLEARHCHLCHLLALHGVAAICKDDLHVFQFIRKSQRWRDALKNATIEAEHSAEKKIWAL